MGRDGADFQCYVKFAVDGKDVNELSALLLSVVGSLVVTDVYVKSSVSVFNCEVNRSHQCCIYSIFSVCIFHQVPLRKRTLFCSYPFSVFLTMQWRVMMLTGQI